jgi:hypothetical protein
MLWQAHFSESRKEMPAAAGISPDDLLITLYEVPGENISFGRGLVQRSHISNTDPMAADLASTRRT